MLFQVSSKLYDAVQSADGVLHAVSKFCMMVVCVRFLNRIVRHPQLNGDSDFVDFVELDGELPKSTSTSTLSGAGLVRLFNLVGDSIGKYTYTMPETDDVRQSLIVYQLVALSYQNCVIRHCTECSVEHFTLFTSSNFLAVFSWNKIQLIILSILKLEIVLFVCVFDIYVLRWLTYSAIDEL